MIPSDLMLFRKRMLGDLIGIVVIFIVMIGVSISFYVNDTIEVDARTNAQLEADNLLVEQSQEITDLENFFDEQLEFYEEQIPVSNPIIITTEGFRQNVPAPRDRISEEDIAVKRDGVIIERNGLERWYIEDTDSMLPTFDEGATVLTIEPQTFSDISVGDIIFFNQEADIIVHRVIEIRDDKFITRGDNNEGRDRREVSFTTIQGVVVGIIY